MSEDLKGYRLWLLLALPLVSCGRPSSTPAPPAPIKAPPSWDNVITKPGLSAITGHLSALAEIGRKNSNRAAGTTGYAESIAYAEGALPSIFIQQKQSFSYKTRKALQAALTLTTPAGKTMTLPPGSWSSRQPRSISFKGSLRLASAPISPYPSSGPGPFRLGPGNGCQNEHYPKERASSRYALVVAEGGCSAAAKQALAAKQGVALLITLGSSHRGGCLGHHHGGQGQLSSKAGSGHIPELLVDPAAWRTLNQAPTALAVELSYQSQAVSTENLIARYSPAGTSGKTIIIGGHLDSVTAGSGINDNGSGVAVLLALAAAINKDRPSLAHDLTLAFWGGEEDGLKGSAHFVNGLSATDKAKIAGYLNLDMVGSPNFGRFLYGSSGQTQKALGGYYQQNDLSTREIIVGARSDHYHFQQAGIDVAGLYTGGIEPKSDEAQSLFGGEAGKSYDACYHLGCDSSANISETALMESYRAIAHTTAVSAGSASE